MKEKNEEISGIGKLAIAGIKAEVERLIIVLIYSWKSPICLYFLFLNSSSRIWLYF